MPTIDIIIPTYDRPAKLSRALASVYAQTMLPAKIVVVDNGQNSKTLEVFHAARLLALGKYRVEYLRSSPGSGRAALATGIEAATANWLILLDDDDFLCPTRVEQDVCLIKKLPPTSVLIQHSFVRVDYIGERLWTHTVDDKLLTLESALKLTAFGPPPSCTIRRDVAQSHHPFHEPEGWFDYDLYASLLAHGTAHAHPELGYAMDDTRVGGRETTDRNKPARITLLHWEQHGHLAARAHVAPKVIEEHIQREVAFYLAKGKGLGALFGQLSNFVYKYPIDALKGLVSSWRRKYFAWLDLQIRGSSVKTFEKAKKSDPKLMQWIEKNKI